MKYSLTSIINGFKLIHEDNNYHQSNPKFKGHHSQGSRVEFDHQIWLVGQKLNPKFRDIPDRSIELVIK